MSQPHSVLRWPGLHITGHVAVLLEIALWQGRSLLFLIKVSFVEVNFPKFQIHVT